MSKNSSLKDIQKAVSSFGFGVGETPLSHPMKVYRPPEQKIGRNKGTGIAVHNFLDGITNYPSVSKIVGGAPSTIWHDDIVVPNQDYPNNDVFLNPSNDDLDWSRPVLLQVCIDWSLFLPRQKPEIANAGTEEDLLVPFDEEYKAGILYPHDANTDFRCIPYWSQQNWNRCPRGAPDGWKRQGFFSDGSDPNAQPVRDIYDTNFGASEGIATDPAVPQAGALNRRLCTGNPIPSRSSQYQYASGGLGAGYWAQGNWFQQSSTNVDPGPFSLNPPPLWSPIVSNATTFPPPDLAADSYLGYYGQASDDFITTGGMFRTWKPYVDALISLLNSETWIGGLGPGGTYRWDQALLYNTNPRDVFIVQNEIWSRRKEWETSPSAPVEQYWGWNEYAAPIDLWMPWSTAVSAFILSLPTYACTPAQIAGAMEYYKALFLPEYSCADELYRAQRADVDKQIGEYIRQGVINNEVNKIYISFQIPTDVDGSIYQRKIVDVGYFTGSLNARFGAYGLTPDGYVTSYDQIINLPPRPQNSSSRTLHPTSSQNNISDTQVTVEAEAQTDQSPKLQTAFAANDTVEAEAQTDQSPRLQPISDVRVAASAEAQTPPMIPNSSCLREPRTSFLATSNPRNGPPPARAKAFTRTLEHRRSAIWVYAYYDTRHTDVRCDEFQARVFVETIMSVVPILVDFDLDIKCRE